MSDASWEIAKTQTDQLSDAKIDLQ